MKKIIKISQSNNKIWIKLKAIIVDMIHFY